MYMGKGWVMLWRNMIGSMRTWRRAEGLWVGWPWLIYWTTWRLRWNQMTPIFEWMTLPVNSHDASFFTILSVSGSRAALPTLEWASQHAVGTHYRKQSFLGWSFTPKFQHAVFFTSTWNSGAPYVVWPLPSADSVAVGAVRAHELWSQTHLNLGSVAN